MIAFFVRLYKTGFINLVGRVFTNSPGDLGSIPGRVIPKTRKMVLDTSLLNTHHYMLSMKGKVEQSRKMLYQRIVARKERNTVAKQRIRRHLIILTIVLKTKK